jgi:hypothetical protein
MKELYFHQLPTLKYYSTVRLGSKWADGRIQVGDAVRIVDPKDTSSAIHRVEGLMCDTFLELFSRSGTSFGDHQYHNASDLLHGLEQIYRQNIPLSTVCTVIFLSQISE